MATGSLQGKTEKMLLVRTDWTAIYTQYVRRSSMSRLVIILNIYISAYIIYFFNILNRINRQPM